VVHARPKHDSAWEPKTAALLAPSPFAVEICNTQIVCPSAKVSRILAIGIVEQEGMPGNQTSKNMSM